MEIIIIGMVIFGQRRAVNLRWREFELQNSVLYICSNQHILVLNTLMMMNGHRGFVLKFNWSTINSTDTSSNIYETTLKSFSCLLFLVHTCHTWKTAISLSSDISWKSWDILSHQRSRSRVDNFLLPYRLLNLIISVSAASAAVTTWSS